MADIEQNASDEQDEQTFLIVMKTGQEIPFKATDFKLEISSTDRLIFYGKNRQPKRSFFSALAVGCVIDPAEIAADAALLPKMNERLDRLEQRVSALEEKSEG